MMAQFIAMYEYWMRDDKQGFCKVPVYININDIMRVELTCVEIDGQWYPLLEVWIRAEYQASQYRRDDYWPFEGSPVVAPLPTREEALGAAMHLAETYLGLKHPIIADNHFPPTSE